MWFGTMSTIDAEAEVVRLGDERVEVGERAELRVDADVVRDVVAVVGAGRGVERRQPDAVDAEIAQVGQARADPGQVAEPVAVGVGEAADVDLVEDRVRHQRPLDIRAATAFPTSLVPASPPRSRVRGPSRQTSSIARSSRACASLSPRCSSISAALQIAPSGFAIPRPAMSGAEPCTGSKIAVVARAGGDAGARRHPHAALERGGDVGEDVAEEVRGDDDVEARAGR